MIRLRHLSGSLQGRTTNISKSALRMGRAPDCDVKFDHAKDPKVSSHHAELLLEEGEWVVIDTGSTNGTLVNGRKISKQRLKPGDQVQLGKDGPLVAVDFVPIKLAAAAASANQIQPVRTQAVNISDLKGPEPHRFDDTVEMSSIAADLKLSADTQTASLAELAAKKVALAREKSGGVSSGQTMMIMADTIKQVQQGTQSKTKKRWVKILAIAGACAGVVVLALGITVWQQKKHLDGMVAEKSKIDGEIAKVERQMEDETDPDKLDELQQRLDQLSGKAQSTIADIGKKNKTRAQEVEDAGDDLDHEIRRILKSFDATTYAVPHVFKERLKFHLDALAKAPERKRVYRRKQQYWPMILKEFGALGLPEEMAYIAWAESRFDPEAASGAGAVGLWQLGASTARAYKLRVDKTVDERLDPDKATHAAAHYLANLLAEFGSDAFMLAMASYNKGESGVRRVLHQIAQEKGGFRKEKRDFWHLYRMKKLPEETREYVPKVLAAAIVGHDPVKYGLE